MLVMPYISALHVKQNILDTVGLMQVKVKKNVLKVGQWPSGKKYEIFVKQLEAAVETCNCSMSETISRAWMTVEEQKSLLWNNKLLSRKRRTNMNL